MQGEHRLREAGVVPDQSFPRALLLDLCRTGDAFTGGSGVSEPITESLDQLDLDFARPRSRDRFSRSATIAGA